MTPLTWFFKVFFFFLQSKRICLCFPETYTLLVCIYIKWIYHISFSNTRNFQEHLQVKLVFKILFQTIFLSFMIHENVSRVIYCNILTPLIKIYGSTLVTIDNYCVQLTFNKNKSLVVGSNIFGFVPHKYCSAPNHIVQSGPAD